MAIPAGQKNNLTEVALDACVAGNNQILDVVQ
jgi:hypothetical protein